MAEKKKKEYKNDLFGNIAKLDKGQYKWFNDLSDEQVKDLSPWALQRWITSSTKDTEVYKYLIQAVNGIVNVNFNRLAKDHKQLQIMLLAGVGLGESPRRTFVHPGSSGKKDKFMEYMSNFHQDYNDTELEIAYGNMDTKERKRFLADEHGMTDKEIKELLK